MKRTIAIIAILLFLLTACAKEAEVGTGEATEASESAVKDFDVRIVGNRIDPDTMTVEQGDLVRLHFLNTEPNYFSLDAFDVNEYIDTGLIEFTASKKGSFNYVCTDCDGDVLGVLYVR